MNNKTKDEIMKEMKKAYDFILKKHGDQKDDCGDNYIDSHLIPVSRIMSVITDDIEIIQAALLHDVFEDTNATYEEVREEFGGRVADLVLAVTKTTTPYGKKVFRNLKPKLENQDAILIKFADRLSNLSRLKCWGKKRQKKYIESSVFWNFK